MIIPTILAKNKREFLLRFNLLIKVAKNIQIDFMDRKFVKSKSLELTDIPNLKKYKNNFEAHLMVNNPERYLKKLKRKGFKKVIFHYESLKNHKHALSIIEKMKELELKPYLALNPETKIWRAVPFLPKVKGVLLMGVHPGKEHQKLIPSTLNKIRFLRRINKKIKIQIDGGVNDKTASTLTKLGATNLNSGSFISKSKNPKESYQKLALIQKKCKPQGF